MKRDLLCHFKAPRFVLASHSDEMSAIRISVTASSPEYTQMSIQNYTNETPPALKVGFAYAYFNGMFFNLKNTLKYDILNLFPSKI